MNGSWKKKLTPSLLALLKGSLHGIEKECLRITKEGELALTPHPQFLGSALTNPYISTDFSESQLELITPPFKSASGAKRFLLKLEAYLAHHLKEEILWPSSAPCRLPNEGAIPLANYGTSNWGQEKHLYRKGLCHRYGKKMQMLSGIHYNYSFSEAFWDALHKEIAPNQERDAFVSEAYLRVVRNFIRLGWINSYLFGATPVVDKSYLQTQGYEFATSIRMSHLGYYSKIQKQVPISFNDFKSYREDLQRAITTPYPSFKNIKEQLNDHILQIEAEHYTRIRPKPKLLGHEPPLEALNRSGIRYLEVRALDINPFTPEGVDLSELQFLDQFLLYCLFKESPPILPSEHDIISENQNQAALFGRNPNLYLCKEGKKVKLTDWAEEILDEMEAFVSHPSITQQRKKIKEPELTPSAMLLREMKEKNLNFQEYTLELAKKNQKKLKKTPVNPAFETKMEKVASESISQQKIEEFQDDFHYPGYEDMEISTQVLIKEAHRRGVTVEILDRKDNFIRLSKNSRIEYVKQATKTSRDSLISYLLMENKYTTKLILEERGVPVPHGKLFTSEKEALEESYQGNKLVVKPNFTNYGLGIFFVESQKEYEHAICQAFTFGDEVIVEDFCEGEEYRFLVIDNRVAAICQRIPANVVGNGVHTIRQLVKLKNRFKYYPIRVVATPGAIPKPGERVFLRENSNVSTGGDSIDKTDDVHMGYHKIAIDAAKALDATFCGVDMMIHDCKKAPTKRGHHILELNFNPALLIHRFPTEGKRRYVEKGVLDALGF